MNRQLQHGRALSFDELVHTAAKLGIERLEFAGGNWSQAPHLALDQMLDSAPARQECLAKLDDHGISISALNCSGNPLHPGPIGERHREVTRKTIPLAGLMEVERVVMMSGCPGGPGDANANWVLPGVVREQLPVQPAEVLGAARRPRSNQTVTRRARTRPATVADRRRRRA